MTHDRISIDAKVMGGKPVIAGTRVTVEQIARECARGLTVAEVVAQYPRLKSDDVSAAVVVAASNQTAHG